MKFARFALVLFACVFLLSSARLAYAHSHHKAKSAAVDLSGGYPQIHSDYAVLIDADTGKVLYAKNPYAHREPASLTKMAAAIVLLEDGRLNDTVTAPPGINDVPESSLHLSPGEQLSLRDLLYAMLLRSANDTPIAGAYYLCGGVPQFVGLMNQKVAEIGCRNTHFVTPNGLYNPDHYSCAYDLALIARYATLNLPTFDKIVRTRRYKIHRTIHTDDTVVVNTASTFLNTFPGADGIKTGFISQAGHCFVGSATQNGWRLIAVSLDSNKCREDVESMLAYGFKNYRPVLAMSRSGFVGTVPVQSGRSNATVVPARDFYDVLPKTAPAPPASACTVQVYPIRPLSVAPVQPGQKVGTMTLFVAGKPVDTVDALAASAVAAKPRLAASRGWSGNLRALGTILLAVVGGLVAFALASFLGLVLYARAITKNSRRRRSRLAQGLRAVD